MTAQHRLDLHEPGTFSGATVVCLGGPEDECQQWCTEEQCQTAEGCSGDDILLSGTDVELIAQAPLGVHRWSATAYDGCRIADWINNCGIEDTCADDDVVLWSADGSTQPRVRPGLIEVEWTGDDYIWSYKEAVTA